MTDELTTGDLRSDPLIRKGLAGELAKDEQAEIAESLRTYRDMASRTEKALHRWSKIFEEAGIKL